MKADITKEGKLIVTAETNIEAWALNSHDYYGENTIIDCSILLDEEDIKSYQKAESNS